MEEAISVEDKIQQLKSTLSYWEWAMRDGRPDEVKGNYYEDLK